MRELVHSLAVREDRKLSSKELDTIALAAEHALGALAPVLETIETGKGTAKGNARKQLDRVTTLPAGRGRRRHAGRRARSWRRSAS